MPKIPKLLADIFVPFLRKSTVISTNYFHPQFKKIVLQSDDIKGIKCTAGGQIEPRVSDTEFRHYNPSAYDSKTGTLEMLLYLHDKGPGSAWAEKLKVGDTIYMMGPANKISLNTTVSKIVLLGDETAMGTFLFMQNEAKKTQQITGAVEIEKNLEEAPKIIGLKLPIAIRKKEHGTVLLNWLQLNIEDNRTAQFYLLGNATTNTLLKNYLKENGVSGSQITTAKYWAEGKTGL